MRVAFDTARLPRGCMVGSVAGALGLMALGAVLLSLTAGGPATAGDSGKVALYGGYGGATGAATAAGAPPAAPTAARPTPALPGDPSTWVEQLEQEAVYDGASSNIMTLFQKDFDKGTLRIRYPGIYSLTEDIVFNPAPHNDGFPDPHSGEYPMGGGYLLGFFAAITIETSGVVLDLGGYSIKMADEFYLKQRYFSLIELANRPFDAKQGPSTMDGVEEPLVPASKVVIRNGALGLSSHCGIHGNNNADIVIKDVQIRDFEKAGIHLNGAQRVYMDTLLIGPTTTSAPAATLSHARFLTHFSKVFVESDPALRAKAEHTKIKFCHREEKPVSEYIERLKGAMEAFIDKRVGRPVAHPELAKAAEAVFGNGPGLPDSSSVYGILLDKTGMAIGPYESSGASGWDRAGDVTMKEVVAEGLKVNVDNVVAVADEEGKTITGAFGDALRLIRTSSCGIGCQDLGYSTHYVGDVLIDAQLALAKLHNLDKHAMPWWDNYHGMAVPQAILDWAAEDAGNLQAVLKQHKYSLICDKDALGQPTLGAIGIGVKYLDKMSMTGVKIRDIINTGAEARGLCHRGKSLGSVVRKHDSTEYLGMEAHGLVVSHSSDVRSTGPYEVQIEAIKAVFGKACGADIQQDNSGVCLMAGIDGITGDMGHTHASGAEECGPMAYGS